MSIKRRRELKKKIIRFFVTIVIIVVLGFVLLTKVFVIKHVKVEGNELYSDKVIENAILNDKYSWSSLYVFLKYRFRDADPVPFIDTMEITLDTPQTLHINVFEKGMLGYVYVPSLDKNAYFDKDGIVIELSKNVIDGVVEISGLNIEKVQLYKKLPLKNENVFNTLLGVSQILHKYEVSPDEVSIDADGNVWMNFADVRVNLGGNVYLNEKVLRLQNILPELEGMRGVLNLNTWTPSNTDVYFSKDTSSSDGSADTGDADTGDADTEDTDTEGTDTEGADTKDTDTKDTNTTSQDTTSRDTTSRDGGEASGVAGGTENE